MQGANNESKPASVTPKNGDLLALYGSLRKGLGGIEQIGVASALRYVGPCILAGQLFDLGDYPGLRKGTGHVIGEIHAVLDVRAFSALDQFEDFHPDRPAQSLYLRERTDLIEPARTSAWVYYYNALPDESNFIQSGDWRAQLALRETEHRPR